MARIVIENMRGSVPRVRVKSEDSSLFVSCDGILYHGKYLKQSRNTAEKYFTDDNTLIKNKRY